MEIYFCHAISDLCVNSWACVSVTSCLWVVSAREQAETRDAHRQWQSLWLIANQWHYNGMRHILGQWNTPLIYTLIHFLLSLSLSYHNHVLSLLCSLSFISIYVVIFSLCNKRQIVHFDRRCTIFRICTMYGVRLEIKLKRNRFNDQISRNRKSLKSRLFRKSCFPWFEGNNSL